MSKVSYLLPVGFYTSLLAILSFLLTQYSTQLKLKQRYKRQNMSWCFMCELWKIKT